MSGDLDGAKAALADALHIELPMDQGLTIIFEMVGELSWQLVNWLDDMEEDSPDVPSKERIDLAQFVEGKLDEALTEIARVTRVDDPESSEW